MELLCAVLIIGILAAVALPSLLRQVNKAKEVEPQTTISHLNKRQQERYQEAASFTESLPSLGISYQSANPPAILGILGGSMQESPNYLYGIKTVVYNNYPLAVHVAISKKSALHSYIGGVYVRDTYIPTCGPVDLPVSLSSSQWELLPILQSFIYNPAQYCPNFVN